MKNSIAGVAITLLFPFCGYCATSLHVNLASFEAAAGPTEALITSARQVALASQVNGPPAADSALGSNLTFLREHTRLARSFDVQALEGAGITFDDQETVPLPLFDNALSIGDIDDAQNDDWEINLVDGPPMRAFGVVIRNSQFETGEGLLLLDQNGAVLDTVDLGSYVGDLNDFVGVVTDFDFFGVRFDEGAGGDDIAIADIRFAVPVASWTATSRSQSGALRPSLTTLNDGRVLRSAGVNGSPAVVFNPRSAAWSPTAALDDPRRPMHAVALLNSGRVLLAGGIQPAPQSMPRARADLYLPRFSQWSRTGDMNEARAGSVAVPLADGRVLVAGGVIDDGSKHVTDAELYQLANGRWQLTANMGTGRSGFAGARLDDGTILVAGGFVDGDPDARTATAEIFDPASGTWSPTGAMNTARGGHLLRRLRDGAILAVGGLLDTEAPSAEVYDPAAGVWAAVAAPALRRPTGLVLLPDGRVLAGGEFSVQGFPQPMEIYDPVTDQWNPTAEFLEYEMSTAANLRFARLLDGRAFAVNDDGKSWVYDDGPVRRLPAFDGPAVSLQTATLMASGQVLVAGGSDIGNVAQRGSALFILQTGNWIPTGDLGQARRDHAAVLLNDGRVLAVGGFGASTLATAELFDPAGAGQWSATGSLNQARSLHTANLLDDGSVLVVGGLVGALGTRSVELYSPVTGFWSEDPICLPEARQRHTATTLLDGRVLVVGGLVNGAPTPLAAVYDPGSGVCSPVASMRDARSLHTATLLPGGRVLVTGGRDANAVARFSAEIFDPATNQWEVAAPLGNRRKEHVATMLPQGRVLVTGGRNEDNLLLGSAEIYDPVARRWYGVTGLEQARRNHRATALFAGQVLVHGGEGALASTELLTLGSELVTAGRPVIDGLASTPAADDALEVTGSLFSVGADGAGDLQSDSRQPGVVIRRLDNGALVNLTVDPVGGWSANHFAARVSEQLVGGPALVTVWSGGIASQPVYRVLGPRLRLFADGFED